MPLYFMRHTEAEDSGPSGDASRRLTERGQRRAEEAGRALCAMDVKIGLILTSPLMRARQTAEAVGEQLGAPVTVEPLLGSDFSPEDLAGLFSSHDLPSEVMLVGHEPTFSWVIGSLVGGASVEMKKGAIACLSAQGFARGGAVLRWLLTGKQLSLLGGGNGN